MSSLDLFNSVGKSEEANISQRHGTTSNDILRHVAPCRLTTLTPLSIFRRTPESNMDVTMIVASLVGMGAGFALRSIPWCRISGTRKVATPGDFIEMKALGSRCNACGAAVIEEDSRFCPRCGTRLFRSGD